MWYAFLQDNYKTREEWTAYAETYGLHERLGYATPDEAWDANPFIQGSSDPADYSRADLTQAYSKRMRRWSAEKLDRESAFASRVTYDGPEKAWREAIDKEIERRGLTPSR